MRCLLTLLAGCTLLILACSCSNGSSGQGNSTRSLPEQGVIHEKIACTGDPGKTYALFIPSTTALHKRSGSNGNLLYPVIVAFDPHGDGLLPVTLYKNLAEKYGFILVGSNDSKNGLQQEQVSDIVTALMHEVHTVYPVDTNRIYLLGFSGGARIAAMTAMYQVPVKGVIGCGAGFGGGGQPIRYIFDYFGIVGTADFNMSEMQNLEEPLTNAGFRHFITTFPGKHAWPPAVVTEDGFIWISLNAMKDGILAKDDVFISEAGTVLGNRLAGLKSDDNLIAAACLCREKIAFMEGLSSVEKDKQELQILESRPDYQSQVAYRNTVLKKEEEEKQELIRALQEKDLAWWKKEISKYEGPYKAGNSRGRRINPEDTLKDRRLMAFLSLFCYMNASSAVAKQEEQAAIKTIAVYEMADSSNAEPNYLRAILLARRSENEAAIAQLRIAVKKGFADKQRLTGQQEFQSLKGSPSWEDLQKTMK
ncbi:MAG: hypothetical protein NT040_17900 [Bacteroidetes bacterium]|nr:hypothetical protein [Bacteroidota bacterium]